MTWSDIPSLNGLRAFSVLAETGSVSLAARQLNVTHAAVSQQIKSLEAHLGLALVLRDGRGKALTPEGAALARDLTTGFDIIRKGVAATRDTNAARPVQITMSPAFAVEWLMPRLPEFQRQHPEIVLMLNPTADVIELRPGGIDLAIRYTDRRRFKDRVEPLLVCDMVTIGSVELLGDTDYSDPASLAELPWLQELGVGESEDWFRRRNITLTKPLGASEMPGNLIMQAVRRGDGITYTVRDFFERDIEAGRMRVLFSEPAFGIFYLEAPPGRVRRAVATVIDWIKGEAEKQSATSPAP